MITFRVWKAAVSILLFVISLPGFAQEDKELLSRIRSEYYTVQNSLSSYQKILINDTTVGFLSDGYVVKIALQGKSAMGEYYYYKENSWPYFVFTIIDKKENRYYFNTGDKPSSMFRWVNAQKETVDVDLKSFETAQQHYSFKGVNLKTIANNRKVSEQKIAEIKQLMDSVQNLSVKFDTISGRPFAADNPELTEEEREGTHVGDEAYFELLSTDKTIRLTTSESWYDCGGGGSREDQTYHLLATNEKVTCGKTTTGTYNKSGFHFIKSDFIRYQGSDGFLYLIGVTEIDGKQLVEEWKLTQYR